MIPWTDEEMSLESEQLKKWLQQLGISTFVTTICENVNENYTHRVMTRRHFCRFDYVMRETGRNYTYSARVLYTISGILKGVRMSKAKTTYSLNPQNFFILTKLCSRTRGITRVLEMNFWTVSYVGQASERSHKMKLSHFDYVMRGKMRETSVQDGITRRL